MANNNDPFTPELLKAAVRDEIEAVVGSHVRRLLGVQVIVQAAIQALAYGSVALILWRLDQAIQRALNVLGDVPGEALQNIPGF